MPPENRQIAHTRSKRLCVCVGQLCRAAPRRAARTACSSIFLTMRPSDPDVRSQHSTAPSEPPEQSSLLLARRHRARTPCRLSTPSTSRGALAPGACAATIWRHAPNAPRCPLTSHTSRLPSGAPVTIVPTPHGRGVFARAQGCGISREVWRQQRGVNSTGRCGVNIGV
eukprot:352788-Chlamydomonas_euryale.AAC.4